VLFGGLEFLAVPAAVVAQATTQPVAQPTLKVLVIPFAAVGGTTSHEWVSAAIQENFMTDVASNPSVWALGLDHPIPAGDTHRALDAGRNAGASLVVSGSYQYTDSGLRITGQVLDVNDGHIVTTLKATGMLADLFKMEDTLTSQLQAVLPAGSNLPVVSYGANQSPAPVYASQPQDVQPQQVGPQQVGPQQIAPQQVAPQDDTTVAAPPATTYVYQAPTYTTPTYVYTYPAYNYSYAYSAPYCYGGYYGGPVYLNFGWGGYYGRPYWGGYHYYGGLRGGYGYHGGFGGGFRGGFSGGFHGGVGFHGGFGHR
jgi:TolB-like protein